MLDGGFAKGSRYYWKATFLPTLKAEAVKLAVEAFAQSPTILCGIIFEHIRGQMTRIDPTATAYPHRTEGINVVVVAQWTDSAQDEECVAWARSLYDALQAHGIDSPYVNYLDADEAGRIRNAYGPNYDRLVRLKRTLRPGQPVPPEPEHRPGVTHAERQLASDAYAPAMIDAARRSPTVPSPILFIT